MPLTVSADIFDGSRTTCSPADTSSDTSGDTGDTNVTDRARFTDTTGAKKTRKEIDGRGDGDGWSTCCQTSKGEAPGKQEQNGWREIDQRSRQTRHGRVSAGWRGSGTEAGDSTRGDIGREALQGAATLSTSLSDPYFQTVSKFRSGYFRPLYPATVNRQDVGKVAERLKRYDEYGFFLCMEPCGTPQKVTHCAFCTAALRSVVTVRQCFASKPQRWADPPRSRPSTK